jgi:hypothetical protein
LHEVKERLLDRLAPSIIDDYCRYLDGRIGYPIPEPEILEHLNNPDINMVFIPNGNFLFNFYQ